MTFASQNRDETGVALPNLGLGCASLGNLYEAITDDDATAVLAEAWRCGIRYFDTAPLYGFGLSETRLGSFLSSRPRNEFLVSTKVGRRLVDNSQWHAQRAFFIDAAPMEPVFDYSYEGIMASVDESLARLRLDSLDLLLMHDIGAATHGARHEVVLEQAMTEGLRAMVELREKGTVKAIGLGVNEWQVCDEVMSRADWDYFLLAGRYTLLEHEPLNGFFEHCTAHGINLIIGGAFNSGVLATGACVDAKYDYGTASPELLEHVKRLADACALLDVQLPAAALQFPLFHPVVESLVVGMATPEQVEQAVENVNSSIDPQLWTNLKNQNLLPKNAPTPVGVSA